MVTAYILIQTEVGKAAKVAKDIIDITGVLQAQAVTGPYDVIVRAEARNIDELGQLVVARVQAVDGITPDPHLPGGAPLVRHGHLRLDRAAATTTRAETGVCGEQLHWRHPGHRRLCTAPTTNAG